MPLGNLFLPAVYLGFVFVDVDYNYFQLKCESSTAKPRAFSQSVYILYKLNSCFAESESEGERVRGRKESAHRARERACQRAAHVRARAVSEKQSPSKSFVN